jgi:hypothetical protein
MGGMCWCVVCFLFLFMTCLVVQSASVARQVRAQRRAFFSVTFMRKHRLETGDVIWIHAKNKETKALGIAWPSFSIQQEKGNDEKMDLIECLSND